MDPENTITLSVSEYKQLLEDSRKLDLLREFGVDNWDGFGDAIQEYRKIYESEGHED